MATRKSAPVAQVREPRGRYRVAPLAVPRASKAPEQRRALLDVNVLIALLDTDRIHHVRAARWLSENIEVGWA